MNYVFAGKAFVRYLGLDGSFAQVSEVVAANSTFRRHIFRRFRFSFLCSFVFRGGFFLVERRLCAFGCDFGEAEGACVIMFG